MSDNYNSCIVIWLKVHSYAGHIVLWSARSLIVLVASSCMSVVILSPSVCCCHALCLVHPCGMETGNDPNTCVRVAPK